MICEYLLPFSRFPFHFDDGFLCCAEAFKFDAVPFVYFSFCFPCLWSQIHKNIAKTDVFNIVKTKGYRKSSSKREVHSNTGLPQETRKIPNKQSYFTPKETRKRRTNESKNSRRKEIIKIRMEINGIETIKTIEKINETKLVLWKDKQSQQTFS